MTKKQALIGLLSVALFLAATDFFINGYFASISEVSYEEEDIFGGTTEVRSKLPTSFTQALPEGVEVQDSIAASTLFNRLIVSELNLKEAVQTPILEGIQKYGIVYEFSGGEKTYFQLHSALELILEESDSVFDANNLGDYSFYYNDAKRPNTVFFLALIDGRVWGFEYPRTNHEQFKQLTQLLINS